ncbi:MAG TPA: hypothetical protein ENJ08_02810 [Gammaproteobacteria bacterium]|nr:hypothetical protein [Gammaproteobacteria bacterium]
MNTDFSNNYLTINILLSFVAGWLTDNWFAPALIAISCLSIIKVHELYTWKFRASSRHSLMECIKLTRKDIKGSLLICIFFLYIAYAFGWSTHQVYLELFN